ncbi:MAG: hypothetical protein ACHQVK_04135, partial [Candidatus Paceibacterales bacterium]
MPEPNPFAFDKKNNPNWWRMIYVKPGGEYTTAILADNNSTSRLEGGDDLKDILRPDELIELKQKLNSDNFNIDDPRLKVLAEKITLKRAHTQPLPSTIYLTNDGKYTTFILSASNDPTQYSLLEGDDLPTILKPNELQELKQKFGSGNVNTKDSRLKILAEKVAVGRGHSTMLPSVENNNWLNQCSKTISESTTSNSTVSTLSLGSLISPSYNNTIQSANPGSTPV